MDWMVYSIHRLLCSMSGRRVSIAYPLQDPMVANIAEKLKKHPAQVSRSPHTPPASHCVSLWFAHRDGSAGNGWTLFGGLCSNCVSCNAVL